LSNHENEKRKLIMTNQPNSPAIGGSNAPTTAIRPTLPEDLAVREEDVEVETLDGTADAVLHYPDGDGPWPAVLVWPDIVGLRPIFRAMGRRLAAKGFVVLTPNLYYRERLAPLFGPGFSFANPADKEAAFNLRATLSDEHIERDSIAFVHFLDSAPKAAKASRIGVHGYCLGGAFALRTAASATSRIGAVASFHPANLVTAAESSPHLLIEGTDAAYLVEIACNDDAADPQATVALTAAFERSGLAARVDVRPANHGWCIAGSAAFDHEQAEASFASLAAFYAHWLG
jgi:carboxymethylenebutenolidase